MHHDPNGGIDKSDYTRDNRTAHSETAPPIPPPPPTMPYHGGRHMGVKVPSRFILFILAWLPGLGHMYMGLIRRGLFYMSATALSIFLTVQMFSNWRFFGFFGIFAAFSIAAVLAVSFFETLSLRRDIVMGKTIEDQLPAFLKNKGTISKIALVILVVVGISFVSSLTWYGWLIMAFIGVVAITFVMNKKSEK
ncbi:MAG: hypothetical protein FWE44_01925 [Defluviitaleaceae bacterium]|nr:hypothetical protein [Defluviitaleaceae bacterium]